MYLYRHMQLLKTNPDQRLLRGDPQTCGMKAGHVTLEPGCCMPTHSTRGKEELLICLEGAGVVGIEDQEVRVAAGEVLYIPPLTEHKVWTEERRLRYVYVCAPIAS